MDRNFEYVQFQRISGVNMGVLNVENDIYIYNQLYSYKPLKVGQSYGCPHFNSFSVNFLWDKFQAPIFGWSDNIFPHKV